MIYFVNKFIAAVILFLAGYLVADKLDQLKKKVKIKWPITVVNFVFGIFVLYQIYRVIVEDIVFMCAVR